MANHALSREELIRLVRNVFHPTDQEAGLALITDVPRELDNDRPMWARRRAMVGQWAVRLREAQDELGFPVHLFAYADVGHGNADLPCEAYRIQGGEVPDVASQLKGLDSVAFSQVFASHSMFLAPTEYSTTAPLKVAARQYPFRGATMPGFNAEMLPALKLDYEVIGRRVKLLAQLMQKASAADIEMLAGETVHTLHLDLRYRTAHASGGLQHKMGEVGNLPSGEAYMTPYEGERDMEPSLTQGTLPVQFDDGLVVYEIRQNKAVAVFGDNPAACRERVLIESEPAYANIAELGLGVLADFGVQPIGELLLDEKLGLHIAFGRSEHFGGVVGPAQFSRPDAVVHIDRVYLPSTQPLVKVLRVSLTLESEELPLMEGYHYVLDPARWGW